MKRRCKQRHLMGVGIFADIRADVQTMLNFCESSWNSFGKAHALEAQ